MAVKFCTTERARDWSGILLMPQAAKDTSVKPGPRQGRGCALNRTARCFRNPGGIREITAEPGLTGKRYFFPRRAFSSRLYTLSNLLASFSS
jgi:hypothetical protein